MALSKEQEEWLKKIPGYYYSEKNKAKVKEIPAELLTEEFCVAAVHQTTWLMEFLPDVAKTEAVYLRFKRPCHSEKKRQGA